MSGAPKRTSLLPKPSSIVLDSSVLIAQHAQLTGLHPITIGPNTVLHPHSKLSSALAPVVLDEGCVIFERAKVGVGMGSELDSEGRRTNMSARSNANVRESMRSEGTVLGRNVVVESNAVVEAAEVGEGTVIEVGAVIGRGSIIGKVCKTTPPRFDSFQVLKRVYSIALSRLHLPCPQIPIYQTIPSSLAAPSSVSIAHCSYDRKF